MSVNNNPKASQQSKKKRPVSKFSSFIVINLYCTFEYLPEFFAKSLKCPEWDTQGLGGN
jgi:hypothetical protein